MDVDLQDPPSLLPEMYRILKEEPYDSVATRRSTRKGEPKIRSFLSKEFYNVINKIVLPKESSAGSVSVRNGWNMRISKDLPEKQNGM